MDGDWLDKESIVNPVVALIVAIFRKELLKMHQAKRRIFQNEVIRNVSVCGDRVGWCFVL